MKLMTAAIKRSAPPLYATDGQWPKRVIAKYFHPLSSYTWYGVEFDGQDLFYGRVDGHVSEWGYFSLSELQSIRVRGLPVERDLHFEGMYLFKDGTISNSPNPY